MRSIDLSTSNKYICPTQDYVEHIDENWESRQGRMLAEIEHKFTSISGDANTNADAVRAM